MKINNTSPVSGLYNNYKKVTKKNSNYGINKNFDIEISQTGKDFATAMEKLKSVEPVRKEKVEHIKNEIKNGTYVVDSVKVARAMLLGEVNY